ncbi:hypothetical protein [Nocardia huaxiensis]|uniref:Uncharacterized protein n=1 Tax=Nocardia huaxiensis TaxID=2755382 RepID=A0A7D6V825_9NOCA|nr:hypothetical protein [Nocardia huaxiensis]QLY27922.1 hypothetical protein H0264_21085 [Nocardia huaxiensis]UFS98669.1 hypothetical protein LPY97_12610 [Nocardia huaxiensis]
MKRFTTVLTAAVTGAIAIPLIAAATATADVWQPAPGISIPLPDGVFTGSAGVQPSTPPSPEHVEGEPCGDNGGHWVHLDGGNATHYGTEWLCRVG